MDLRPKKLTAAYAALLDVLAHGRSMAVASAVALTREIADVSERTIYAARARLPITCIVFGARYFLAALAQPAFFFPLAPSHRQSL